MRILRKSYREIIEANNESLRDGFNDGDPYPWTEERRTKIIKKLANIAAFANKFASDEFKNNVDKVSNIVFESHSIESRLAEIVDNRAGGIPIEEDMFGDVMRFRVYDSEYTKVHDTNVGNSTISVSDNMRNFINSRIEEERNKESGRHTALRKLHTSEEEARNQVLFDSDGNIVAQRLIDNLDGPYSVSDFVDDLVEKAVYDLEKTAESEGYDNTRLAVYHDGRIEPSYRDLYVYLDNIPPDNMEELYKEAEAQSAYWDDDEEEEREYEDENGRGN